MVNLLFTEYMSEPPRHADSKNSIFIIFFAEFRVRVNSGARGSVSRGFRVSRQLSFFGGGGGLARGQHQSPPPPKLEARPPFGLQNCGQSIAVDESAMAVGL